jgi:tetratricopeptide (TPR) repeat protein
MTMSGTRPAPFLMAALFGVVLLVYARTLCPTVYWEDAGELITVSHVLGIAHPPGHPLYTILGHLFSFIPWGTIAARVNFMSACFGAIASALVYPTVLRLLRDRTERTFIAHCAGAAAALFAAFGLTLWDQAVVAETSTLHAFFFMLLILLFLETLDAPDQSSFSRRLVLFSFMFGLSLTNHVAGVFLIPAFAIWMLVSARRRISFRNALPSLAFFLVGLSVYLYLPIRSSMNPVIDWGNPETLSNFWQVITAGQFRNDVLTAPSMRQMTEIAADHVSNIRENFMGVGTAFILIGIWRALRRRKDFFLFASVVIVTLFTVTLNPAFITAYFIPALLLLAVFIGLGADAVADALAASVHGHRARRTVAGLICAALLVSPALPLIRHYPMNDRSNYFRARDYGMRILDTLPANAAFFTIDLNAIFTIWYLMYCEGIRTDVLVIEPTWLTNSGPMRQEIMKRHPDLLMPEVGEQIVDGERLGRTSLYDRDLLLAILRKNAEVRPVFWGAVPLVPSLKPRGLIYEFHAADDSFDDEMISWNRHYWEAIAGEFQRVPDLASDRVASLIYPENLQHQGQCFRASGCVRHARWAFELATRMNPAYAAAWLRLGELCESMGEYEDALGYLTQAADLDSRFRARALFVRGRALYQLGLYDRARSDIVDVISEKPDFPNARNMLGSICLSTGDLEGAEREFREEIRINPSTEGAYSNLAQILMHRGRIDEAEKMLRDGVEANGGAWQNFYFLAVARTLQGCPDDAEKLLETAIHIGGPDVLEMARKDAVLGKIRARGSESGGPE